MFAHHPHAQGFAVEIIRFGGLLHHRRDLGRPGGVRHGASDQTGADLTNQPGPPLRRPPDHHAISARQGERLTRLRQCGDITIDQ